MINDLARIKQSIDYPECIGETVIWTEYLDAYKQHLHSDDVEIFRPDSLLKIRQSGQTSFSIEIPYISNQVHEWVKIEAHFDNQKDYATIIVRKTSQEHLLKSIVDLYVYNTCDYFIYLDVKNDSYTMFSGSTSGTPLPPSVCDSYSTEIVKYANDFVVPEDREMVIHEMTLPRVLEKLEQAETHVFTCGILDATRGYTRKRLEYRYYDRATQMVLLCRTDITDLYLDSLKKQEELQQALKRARTDSLTTVLNHQGIQDAISDSLANAGAPSALLVIDLDNFKSINDNYGHAAGDRLLRQVGKILRSSVRADDLVGRIGGDEFLVYFHNISSVPEITSRAHQLCKAIYELSHDFDRPISCSIGIAIAPDDGTDYPTLFNHADTLAYQAKSNGKNQVATSLGES